MIQIIFSYSISLIFFISGISKIFKIKETEKTIIKLNFFGENFSRIIGRSFPFFELVIGCLLLIYYNSILVNLITIFLILVFILINIYGLIHNIKDSCNCFGDWFKSKLGVGGLAQSTLMLILLVPNLFLRGTSNSFIYYEDYQALTFIFTSVIIFTANIIFVRIILDFKPIDQLEG